MCLAAIPSLLLPNKCLSSYVFSVVYIFLMAHLKEQTFMFSFAADLGKVHKKYLKC